MKIIKNRLKSQQNAGFTIVELLVTIVIIAVLAAIVTVSYRGITGKANEAALTADLTNASKKLAMYYAEYGVYPSTAGLNSSTNWCPTLPNLDNDYCLKINPDIKATYSSGTTTYTLNYTKGTIAYEVTNTKSPYLSTAPTEPTLPESDWITIGSQRWARKNLNVGTMVTGATAQANNATTEKYCYSDTESNCTTYGGLYQWDEAMGYSTTEGAQGICPVGTHVPSDNDWKILEVQLGMTQAQADTPNAWRGTDQGTQLKSGGTSGLNVPLAGYRFTDGSFNGLSSDAGLWSSSESGTSAWLRYLTSGYATVYRDTHTKADGFSVRCLGN